MQATHDFDSKVVGDNVDLPLSGFVPSIAGDSEICDVETLSEKGVEKEKRRGHLRIHSDGQVSYKKINSTFIMESTQLGIQETVGRLASSPERDVLMKDFMTVESKTFSISTNEPEPPSPRKSSCFVFKTYAPIAFRHFRDLFGIKPEDFVSSFCDHHLVELPNPGASGSLFYLTQNDEFITKTVQHKEANFLQKLLPGYYLNLNQNPFTLLPKFFGLYCFQRDSKNVRLLVMNNVLPTWLKIHQKYDLKGSTFNRKASVKEIQKDSPTFKDLDFIEHHPEGIFLENNVYKNLMETIQRDCRVLESFEIIDYSLLVGVHNLEQAKKETSPKLEEEDNLSKDEMKNMPFGDGATSNPLEVVDTADFETGKRNKNNNSDNVSMLLKPLRTTDIARDGNFSLSGLPARKANGEKLMLYVGIIDILQSYRFKKRLEHVWKSFIHDGDSVSVHNPSFYSHRFQEFMSKNVFKTLPSSPRTSRRKNVSKHNDKKSEPGAG